MKKKKIAFIGLGVMGFPMAGHLSRSGYDISVYNRTKSKASKWINKYKGNIFTKPYLAANNADIIIICVGRDKDLLEVIEGPNGILQSAKKNSIIIDHTTASAKIAKYFYKKCKKKNIAFLDAPVSGGQSGAENGILSIMVGGDKKYFNLVKPVLSSYGKAISLIGNSGSGQLCKMVNQICIAGLVQGLSEGLFFGKKSKLDMDKVLEVITKGAAQSWQMDNRANTMLSKKFNFGFAVNWMCKDLSICFDQAKSINVNLPTTKIIKGYYEKIRKNGGNRWDTSSLISLLK
ncbi:MAG: oxidoreductase [Pelagibacteraceae bacterium]|nr:oxidoreductase [Pelagibacteraceae bacterium]|tara:strand:- start:19141 stop:20010 length:870 start_codon:yes stop_codon:yes gene_type:complete